MNFVDPTGLIIESGWDVANVGIDVVSLGVNVVAGNYVSAVVDLGALGYDVFATAVPGLPAGAGAALNGARGARAAGHLGRARNFLGEAGERLVCNATNTERLATAAGDVVPDLWHPGLNLIGEIKNVGSLRNQGNLRHMIDHLGEPTGAHLSMALFVRVDTHIPGPLRRTLEQHARIHVFKILPSVRW